MLIINNFVLFIIATGRYCDKGEKLELRLLRQLKQGKNKEF